MVCLTQRHCFACDKDYSCDINDYSGCPHCKAVEEEQKRKEYFASLDALPLEERVRKIEEWIYNHGRVRHGYIPPPRY